MQSTARSSLSDAFVYGNKPRAAPATKSRVHIYPENGGSSGFAPGNTIRLVVPTGNRGEYLNTRQSYIKFRLNNLATDVNDAFAMDSTAHGLFRSLKVSASGGAGGGVLENVEEYNALVQALIDTSVSETQLVLGGSIAEGYLQSVNGGASRVFCLPLVSGVLGTLQQKYLPVGAMARTHLVLELTLGELNRVQFENVPWSLSDFEYVAEMIHLDPAVDRAIAEANTQGIVVPFHTYSQHRWIAPSGSGSMSMSFSSPFRSLKTLMAIFRKDEADYDLARYVSQRANPIGDTGRFQFSVNGVLTPSKEVSSNAEAYAELQKAFHAFGAVDSHGIINHAGWTQATGKYLIALDLESQSHKSALSQNGVDVSTSVSHLMVTFNQQLTTSMTVDVFSHYDSFIMVGADGLVNVFY